MKKTVGSLLGTLLLVTCGGCVVQSFHPFSEDTGPTPNEIMGHWKFSKKPDSKGGMVQANEGIPPWEFKKGSVTTYDDKKTRSELATVFFKLKGNLYCDFTIASDLPKGVNLNWAAHMVPVHTLAKVVLKDEKLSFQLLNFGFVTQGVGKKRFKLPYVETLHGNDKLFTATPEQWQEFLKKYSKEKDVFSDEGAYVFRKATAKEIEASKAKKKEQQPIKVADFVRHQVTLKNLNYSSPLQGGPKATLSMELVLVLGRKPEEVKKGIMISDKDWAAFRKALTVMEPLIRDKLRQHISKQTLSHLNTPAGKENIKKYVKDYANGQLKKVDLNLENKALDKDRIVNILISSYYLQ